MSDLTSGYIFKPGEKGIDDLKLNSQLGNAKINPDFYLSKPSTGTMDPNDQLLVVKSDGSFSRIVGSNISASVSGSLTLASPSQSGMLHQTTGNASDYCGGDNQFHPLSSAVPTGTLLDFAGPTANIPSGFLACDGTSYSTTTYAALFAVIGYTWGGSGANFNVPDFRGRTSIGAGTGAGLTARALGAKGGEENHPLVIGELAAHTHAGADHAHGIAAGQFSHNHSASDSGHAHAYDYVASSTPGGASPINIVTGPGAGTAIFTRNASAVISVAANTLPAGGTGLADRGLTTGSQGSGTGHNTMQPFAVVTKIIKA